MYKLTITCIHQAGTRDEAIQKLWSFVGASLQAGLLFGTPLVTIGSQKNTVVATAAAHERSSLAPRHQTPEVRRASRELAPLLRGRPRIELEPFAEDSDTCTCAKPSGMLFTPDVVNEASPFRCMDCGDRRPLYRVGRRIDGQGLCQLSRKWLGFYWAWIDSDATEPLAWRQLADPKSELSRAARITLRELEKKVKSPICYELLNHYQAHEGESAESTACAGCGRPWDVERFTNRLLCQSCRLCALRPGDRNPPDWWTPLPRRR